MRILLTGANGYIGSRLLPVLAEEGHQIVALVRSSRRLVIPDHLKDKVEIVVADLLDESTLDRIPKNIEASYYLVHSMSDHSDGFVAQEKKAAENFIHAIEKTNCQQIIYLSGLAKGELLSEHMQSRHQVEEVLFSKEIPVTVLRAAIIIGAGSASFEIVRDLVEKLFVMIVPKWASSLCQPIAIKDVIFYLQEVLGNKKTYNKTFEIGGPEKLTYLDMLYAYAKVRKLKRWIIPVPVLTPRLSSYWLFFVTSTSFKLARSLVNSLKTNAICSDSPISAVIDHKCLRYEEALERAFTKIEQNTVVSSWKDAVVRSELKPDLRSYIEVPVHGCLKEIVKTPYKDRQEAIFSLWKIGGKSGWYYMDWAWSIRGFLDKLVGGAGLNRGRTHPTSLKNGDVIDFWRVLLADQEGGHLLLYAEMRVPGEAWLEFHIEKGVVTQTATFRPKGLSGRLYWYLLYPIHHFIFRGLCQAVAKGT